MFMFVPQYPTRAPSRAVTRRGSDNALMGTAVAVITGSLKKGLVFWFAWTLLKAIFGKPEEKAQIAQSSAA